MGFHLLFLMTENWNSIPTYRQVPHTRFLVDYFLKLPPIHVSAFFLTHWHYDHYRGLGPNFSQGPIYCSPTTARLLERITLVDSHWIVPKDINESFMVDQVKVTFLDANHCPGSVMILFQTPKGNYLHTGDMRFSKDMKKQCQVLDNLCLDAVYLDTTYCHKKYRFPCQETTIHRILNKIMNKNYSCDSKSCRHTLYLIATYGIGKERIIDALVQNGYRIYVSPNKWKVLQCLEYWDSCLFHQSFTTDPCASPIWLIGWNRIAESVPGRMLVNFEALREMLDLANNCRAAKGVLSLNISSGYSMQQQQQQHDVSSSLLLLQRVVALVPTGWTWQKNHGEYFQEKDNSTLSVYGIPYSEHSNYEELHQFIAWLRPKQVIPTVSSFSTKKQPKHPFSHLLAETQVKRAFLQKWLGNNPSNNHHKNPSEESSLEEKESARNRNILSYFKVSNS